MHIHILGICGTFMGGVAALAREAGHLMRGMQWALLPFLCFTTLRNFISALERPLWGLIIMLLGIPFNVLVGWAPDASGRVAGYEVVRVSSVIPLAVRPSGLASATSTGSGTADLGRAGVGVPVVAHPVPLGSDRREAAPDRAR